MAVELSLQSVDDTNAFSVEESVRDIFMGEEIPDILICLNELNTTCAYQAVVIIIRWARSAFSVIMFPTRFSMPLTEVSYMLPWISTRRRWGRSVLTLCRSTTIWGTPASILRRISV